MEITSKVSFVPYVPEVVRGAEKFDGELAREGHAKVGEEASRLGIPDACWKYDEESGLIRGAETRRMVLLDKFLEGKGKRTLSIPEFLHFDERGLFSNGVWRRFGIVVYGSGSPNEEEAKRLSKAVPGLPALVSYRSLDMDSEGNLYVGRDTSSIISGAEAKTYLEKFHFVVNFGVCGVERSAGGYRDASWHGLFGSGANARVDWIFGEARRENFPEGSIEKMYESEVERLGNKRNRALAAARAEFEKD
jgi:hypothetical protein